MKRVEHIINEQLQQLKKEEHVTSSFEKIFEIIKPMEHLMFDYGYANASVVKKNIQNFEYFYAEIEGEPLDLDETYELTKWLLEELDNA